MVVAFSVDVDMHFSVSKDRVAKQKHTNKLGLDGVRRHDLIIVTSKNSATSDGEFVVDAVRIWKEQFSNALARRMASGSISLCAETLSKQDQQHGARVYKEAPFVTAVGKGVVGQASMLGKKRNSITTTNGTSGKSDKNSTKKNTRRDSQISSSEPSGTTEESSPTGSPAHSSFESDKSDEEAPRTEGQKSADSKPENGKQFVEHLALAEVREFCSKHNLVCWGGP
jgi:hypothetical protein